MPLVHHSDSTWTILGQYLDNTWTILGQYLDNTWTIPGQYLDNTWTILGHYLDNTWKIFGQYLDNTWTILGQFLDNTWTILGQYLDNTWTNTRTKLGQYLDNTWTILGQYRRTTNKINNKIKWESSGIHCTTLETLSTRREKLRESLNPLLNRENWRKHIARSMVNYMELFWQINQVFNRICKRFLLTWNKLFALVNSGRWVII